MKNSIYSLVYSTGEIITDIIIPTFSTQANSTVLVITGLQSTVTERVAATNQQAVQPHGRKSLNTCTLDTFEAIRSELKGSECTYIPTFYKTSFKSDSCRFSSNERPLKDSYSIEACHHTTVPPLFWWCGVRQSLLPLMISYDQNSSRSLRVSTLP